MEKIKAKYQKMIKALDTFDRSIESLNKIRKLQDSSLLDLNLDKEELEVAQRDSVIKRFEYCTDNLWKYVQLYLESVLNLSLEKGGPSFVFRKCLQARLLSQDEIESAIEMVKSRNQTSHIYQEEIADVISKNAQEYYNLMSLILEKTKP